MADGPCLASSREMRHLPEMGVQGRPKGNRAEIEIAKRLKTWWSTFEVAEFVRTPLSGGWGGKDLRAGFRASGDVMTTSVRFPFTIEIKRREGWAWKTLREGRKSPVWGYWRQAVGQAKEMGGTPLLIFRRNREPWFVLLPFVSGIQVFQSYEWETVWFESELKEKKVDIDGVLPGLVMANTFFSTMPHRWTLVAPTFPKP